MGKTGPKLKSKREHSRDVELRLLADEMAMAMLTAYLPYVAREDRVTPGMQMIIFKFIELARKHA